MADVRYEQLRRNNIHLPTTFQDHIQDMATPQRPEQGHSRHQSSDTRRGMAPSSSRTQSTANAPLVAMPRRSTKGPLDVDASSVA